LYNVQIGLIIHFHVNGTNTAKIPKVAPINSKY